MTANTLSHDRRQGKPQPTARSGGNGDPAAAANSWSQDPHAEQALLGSMMVNASCIDKVTAILPPGESWFFSHEHTTLYAALVDMRRAGLPMDLVIARNELTRRGLLDRVGGVPYLVELSEGVPSAAHAEHYAKIVRDFAIRRRLIVAADDIGRSARDVTASGAELARDALTRIEGLADDPGNADGQDYAGIMPTMEILQQPAIEWLVEGVLPARSGAVLFGPPHCGKTFLALDFSCCVATGLAWLGEYAVARAPVIYVNAEGAAGFPSRVRAWLDHHRIDRTAFADHFVRPWGLDLANPDAVTAFIAGAGRVLDGRQAGLVVFDTLSKCLVGRDENSAQDVGLALDGLRRIREELGCSTLAVHHTVKGGEIERGSSTLRGDADTMLKINQNGDIITVRADKMKDAPPFPDILAHRKVVRLGEDGDEPTCILESYDAAPTKAQHDEASVLDAMAFQLQIAPDGVRRKTLEAALTPSAMSETAFDRALRRVVSNGKLRRIGERPNVKYLLTEG